MNRLKKPVANPNQKILWKQACSYTHGFTAFSDQADLTLYRSWVALNAPIRPLSSGLSLCLAMTRHWNIQLSLSLTNSFGRFLFKLVQSKSRLFGGLTFFSDMITDCRITGIELSRLYLKNFLIKSISWWDMASVVFWLSQTRANESRRILSKAYLVQSILLGCRSLLENVYLVFRVVDRLLEDTLAYDAEYERITVVSHFLITHGRLNAKCAANLRTRNDCRILGCVKKCLTCLTNSRTFSPFAYSSTAGNTPFLRPEIAWTGVAPCTVNKTVKDVIRTEDFLEKSQLHKCRLLCDWIRLCSWRASTKYLPKRPSLGCHGRVWRALRINQQPW